MTTKNLSWTVIQRRINGFIDFYRGWSAYKDGFGDVNSEYWLGNDNIHEITSHGNHDLRIELQDFDGNTTYAEYSIFSIADEGNDYRLLVYNYSGNAGDSLTHHNGMRFSTFDKDNDQSGSNCAVSFKGAWWYRDCHFSNLNVYILLDFCTACEPASNFCDIEKWSNWSACNATCGTGVQKREKFMCCQSKSLSKCLSTCNISSSWWQTNAVEFKTCGICNNGGVFDATRNRCKCPIGFVGSCCNDFSVCGLRPCQHGSKCTTNGQGYSCTCTPGYDGFNCQIDIDECVSNPCQNGGSCRDHTNKYSCSCIPGYTGINCQTDTIKTTVKSKTTTIPTMTATSEVTNTETPTTATPTISVTQTGTLPSTIETSTISVTRTILSLPTNTTQTMDSLQRTASSTMSLHTTTATTQAINASKSEITMPSTITIQSRTLSKATTVQSGTSTDATIQSSILPVTTITQNSKIPQTSISTTRTNHTASKPTPILPSSSIISSTIKPNTKKERTNITHSATGSFTQKAQNTKIEGNRNRSVHQNIKTITPWSIFILTNITTQRTSTATNTKEITSTTLQAHLVTTTTHVSTINSKTTPSISVSTINSKTTSSKYVSTTSKKTTPSTSVSLTITKMTPSISVSPTSTKTTPSISLSTINSTTTPSKYVSPINKKTTPSKSVSAMNLKMTPSKSVSTINLKTTPPTAITTANQLTTTSPLLSALISKTPRQTTQTAIISTGTNTKTTNKILTLFGSTISKTITSTKPIWKTKLSKKLLTIQPTTKRNTFTSMVIVSPVIVTLATTLPTKSQTVSKKNVSTSTSFPLRETGRSRASNKATMTNVRTLSVSATHKQLTVPSTQMSTSPSPINSLSITTLNKPILKTTTKKNKRTTKPVIVMKTIPTTLKARSRMTLTIPTLTATQTPIAKTTTNRRTNIASRKRTVKIKRPRLHTTTVKTMPRTYNSESNYGSTFAIAITSVGALILFLVCGFAIWNIIKVFSKASELAKIKPFKVKTNDRSLISDW